MSELYGNLRSDRGIPLHLCCFFRQISIAAKITAKVEKEIEKEVLCSTGHLS